MNKKVEQKAQLGDLFYQKYKEENLMPEGGHRKDRQSDKKT